MYVCLQFLVPVVCVYFTLYIFIFYTALHEHIEVMRYEVLLLVSDCIISVSILLLLKLICTNIYLRLEKYQKSHKVCSTKS